MKYKPLSSSMKFLVLYFFLLSICVASPEKALTQTQSIDSMELALQQPAGDSVRVFAFLQLASQCFNYDSLKALRYLNEGYILTKKLKWDYATAEYYNNKAITKQYGNGNADVANLIFDTAIMFYQKAINANRNKKEVSDARLSIATCKGQQGDLLSEKQKTKEAITAYIEALEAWKNSDNPQKQIAIATYYSKISTIYYKLDQFDKALEYDKLSLSIFMAGTNEEGKAWALVYVCDDFKALKQIDSSLLYLQKAKPIVEKLNNHRLNIQYYNKLGEINRQKKEYHTAIGYYKKTVAEAKITNDSYQAQSNQRLIAVCYIRLGEYATARKYLLMALTVAIANNYAKDKMYIFQSLTTVEEKTNHIAEAYSYLKQSVALSDSIKEGSTKKAVAEIENKYQAAEKEKEIVKLNADKQIQSLSIRQKSTLNYFLIGSLAALIIVGFLGYRNLRHRQQLAKQQDELQQQRIRELEKDKQLVAVDSMLKGQEDERSRLAKDLHDGLGGLLSGVKFSLSNMKDNLIITPDNMAVFERSLDMLDTSIKELRRVAHNMMPEMLTKFGLDEALKEYCNTINATKLLSVKYQSMGMDIRLEKSAEIIIYRIIQELLNNILKHAEAQEVMVQLIKENERFSIIVEDNGKGFDTSIIKNSKGAGLTSIQSRVDYLKGQLDIHSETGKGTLVNIEFNL